LDDYCLTGFGLGCLASVADGLKQNSTRRAWRFTGDYGTGKSSFALLLARCVQSARSPLPPMLRRTISEQCSEFDERNFLPILLTGSHASLGAALLEAIASSIPSRIFKQLPRAAQALVRNRKDVDYLLTDDQIVNLFESVCSIAIEKGLAEGLLIVLDEAGKYLEHAALHTESHDVMLLQRLAECAQRSAEQPILIVCLFHMAFTAYAAQLSPAAQREWEKVSGRFEDVPFAHPLEQVAQLVSAALRVDKQRTPPKLLAEASEIAGEASRMRWIGTKASARAWQQLAPNFFPIDPMLFPVALRFFQKFAQNERSLFSFLFSHEPLGLRAFAACPIAEATLLRIPSFFDYVRANFGHRLAQMSYRTRWSVVEAVIEAATDLLPIEQQVLKTVALLNLLNSDEFRPTEDAIALAVGGVESSGRRHVRRVLATLSKAHRLFFRGEVHGYSVWPYSSVDLDKAYEKARAAIAETRIAASVQSQLPQRAIVARRHYIQTGNLRHFAVEYAAGSDLASAVAKPCPDALADGRLVVALCEDESERRSALEAAQRIAQELPLTLIAVTRPLRQLRGFVAEAQRWEWVSTHTPELNTDNHARGEVSRQLEHTRDMLDRKLDEFVGLHRVNRTTTLEWFHQGASLTRLGTGRALMQKLSDVCDDCFSECAPQIRNELVNRHELSSAAAGARMRLMERMLTHADQPRLGIPETKHPPELSMYLSVLKTAGAHRHHEGTWEIHLPINQREDPCNLRHTFAFLRNELEQSPDTRRPVLSLYSALEKPPFGVKRGLLPLLLTAFASVHGHELAFYERGNFLPQIGGEMFHRLAKVPELFELQWCKIEGLRAQILEDLRHVVSLPPSKSNRTRLLEIVRPLCRFATELPEFSRRTRQLSGAALRVREVLLTAQEPVTLLLHRLPEACGLAPFLAGSTASPATAQAFVRQLHAALRELHGAYGAMIQRLEGRIASQFRLGDQLTAQSREQILQRTRFLKPHLRESRMVALANALTDTNATESSWMAGIGSVILTKSPMTWTDADEARFDSELVDLIGRFLRVEHLHHGGVSSGEFGRAVRVSITQPDGDEVAEVLHVSSDEESRLDEVEKRFNEFLIKEGNVALVAAARQIGEQLSRNKAKT
jgi:hypothetical protein